MLADYLEVARPEQAGTARGEEESSLLLCLQRTLATNFVYRLDSEPISGSGIVFKSRDSAGVSSNAQALRPTLRMLAPGSPSHFARKGSGSDVRRTRSASRHRCERSSSSRVSSILTKPSVVLQTAHVESCVPLSLCLRMKLRECRAAKNGLFIASERPQRLYKSNSPRRALSHLNVIVNECRLTIRFVCGT